MNNVPNLDAMTVEELRDFWRRYHYGAKRKDCEDLIGSRCDGYTVIASKLANYADNKAVAMECRLRGDIQAASIYETICDQIYSRLPEDIKW